ncbi:MAG: glycosyltransferase family 2 protein [Rhodospirillaceae bacterium]|nr:glycosyltransferase family 2 protein [Rhodospirillaceae bacterium]
MPDVDIVIVNYKSASHTVKCVAAVHVAAHQDGVGVDVYVVNNGDESTDFETEVLHAGQATVTTNSENLGFATASNVGARLGNAPFILFLNPDALIHSGALQALTSFLNDPSNGQVGIVGPEVCNSNGATVPSCSRLPSRFDLITRSMGLHALLHKKASYPYAPLDDHAHSRAVGQVMGAALMIRRSLYEQLGGFDERFFLYYEDVDISARAKAMGAESYYLKDACVTHVGRISSSQDAGFSLALHVRSRMTYAGLHFGQLYQFFLLLVCSAIEFPARLLQAMLGRGAVGVRGILRAYKLLALYIFSGTALPKPRDRTQSQY